MRIHKRRGIAWALLILFLAVIVIGIVWTVLYYGGEEGADLLPLLRLRDDGR